MKYFSLFSGIGGFELGIQRNQTKSRDSSNSEGRTSQLSGCPLCVGFSEIDKYAIQIYKKHFPTHKEYGDVTNIKCSNVPDFDLLCGGFPCQSFSIAGKRAGFSDTRGTLFFEIARIAQEKQPRLLLLENVKGLLSHEKGRTFGTILRTLDELGYDLQWQVLNSKNFGVPQNRERIFIIGHLRTTPRPQVFPIGQTNEIYPENNNRTLSKCLDSNYHKGWLDHGQRTMIGKIKAIANLYPSGHEAGNIYDKTGISPTIKCNGPRPNKKNICPKIVDEMKIRRLTPTECERLQGFPDGWTSGISDTQRYKCLGNAVTTNVISAIMKKLMFST